MTDDARSTESGQGKTWRSGTEPGVETIRMTEDGLVMPEELVGYAGQMVVEWPSEKMQKQTISLVDPGIPEVCDYICRGIMPSEEDANGVPGGHLRINGTLYEIEDDRSRDTGGEQ